MSAIIPFVPLGSLSVGQKSTALLIMALSDGSMPVVIDQPEDSLDIRSIWDDICSKVRIHKNQRQFIFTTHNSNVAVASDSDNYVILEANSENGRIVHRGSMDHSPVADEVLRYMEGGVDSISTKIDQISNRRDSCQVSLHMPKLLYISLMRLPTEKAHGLQIMQNCEAFAAAGYDVTLWVARRWNTPDMRRITDPFAHYGIDRNFTIQRMPCLDLFPLFPPESAGARLAFYLLMLSYALALLFRLPFVRPDIYYSRDEFLLWL